jgi:hypothetical protein
VTALNSDGSINTGFVGNIDFWSSDAKSVLPGNYVFTAADHGSKTFYVTLRTAGSQQIAVAAPDSSFGQVTFNVSPGIAVELRMTMSSPLIPGQPISVTVTAYDAFGNVATNFLGGVQFSTNDATAKWPSSYSFTQADKGSHTFSITFETTGLQTDEHVSVGRHHGHVVCNVWYTPRVLTLTVSTLQPGSLANTITVQS